MLKINVAHGIPLLHSVNKSDEIWERRHLRVFVNARPHLKDALKMAAFTGLRLGDLVKLDWDLHVRDKAIIFATKKRKGRTVIRSPRRYVGCWTAVSGVLAPPFETAEARLGPKAASLVGREQSDFRLTPPTKAMPR